MRSDIDCNKYVCGIWINSYERSAQHPPIPVFLSHCFPWQGTRKVCVSNINGNALIDLQPSHPLFTTNSLEPSSTPFIYLIFATYYRSQIFCEANCKPAGPILTKFWSSVEVSRSVTFGRSKRCTRCSSLYGKVERGTSFILNNRCGWKLRDELSFN